MNPATLLAAVLAAAGTPAAAPSARAFLKPAAATAPGCKATAADGGLVSVGLFAKEGAACPVAKVGDDTVPLGELAGAMELRHLQRSPRAPAPAKRPDMDFGPQLERLITTRLLVQEAREMQLDQQPEIQEAVKKQRAATLREMVQAIAAQGAKPNAKEVDRLYRDAVREWKIASVVVDREEDAKALVAALKAGGKFEALAKKLGQEKKGRGDGQGHFVLRKLMLPEILAAVRDAKQGVPLGPVKVSAGFVVLRVEGVRYPKDDGALADARARSLARAQHEAIRRYYLDLVKRHAKVDEALVKQLDFEKDGEKGFQALAEDQRVVATIAGERPVTVADLTREAGNKFFHGMGSPFEQHKVNPGKQEALERLLGSRLFAREAALRKLETKPEFRREMERYERALAFSTFVEKVLAADVKVTEADCFAVYERQKAQLSSPEMFKLDGFAFVKEADAQAALDKLKGGTDFAWLRSTAPGQVPTEARSLEFDGRTVSLATLPPGLASAIAGARAGEYRLYSAGAGETYVVRVVEQSPPTTRPYSDVREAIAKKVYADKLERAIADYAAKLRKVQRVDVLLARISP